MSFADAVRDATGREVRSVERVSGGDINNAFRVQFTDESFAFVKTRADVAPGEYAAEAAGLRWLAEPGALIGFAGQRVIEQVTKQKLPSGFQTAEFQLEHGFIDLIVERSLLRSTIAILIDYHLPAPQVPEPVMMDAAALSS